MIEGAEVELTDCSKERPQDLALYRARFIGDRPDAGLPMEKAGCIGPENQFRVASEFHDPRSGSISSRGD